MIEQSRTPAWKVSCDGCGLTSIVEETAAAEQSRIRVTVHATAGPGLGIAAEYLNACSWSHMAKALDKWTRRLAEHEGTT